MKHLKILMYADCYDGYIMQGLDYLQFMEPYGSVTLLMPSMAHPNAIPELIEHHDVLFLPGGADVDPLRYNEAPSEQCGRVNTQFEFLDMNFLPKWIKSGKPIIGVCRGAQDLNVALGGSLWQHIINHAGSKKKLEEWHAVHTEFDNVNGSDFRLHMTNSRHHQAIKVLGDGLEVLGVSAVYKHCPSTKKKYLLQNFHPWRKSQKKEGMIYKNHNEEVLGIPEIVRHKTKPYVAFQYHPENTNCPLAHHLITQTLSTYYGA